MVEVFRTDVHESAEAEVMLARLRNCAPYAAITFDLEDCDRILRVESEAFEIDGIISCMQAHGYACEILT